MANIEKVLLEKIVSKVEETVGKAKDLKEKGTSDIIAEVAKALPDIILTVEELGSELNSADKKALAIEASLKWANVKVLPDMIERQVIGVFVDMILGLLNKWFGKEWYSKVVTVVSTIWGLFKKIFVK